jgi:glycosyltransferase involved in cell wall biosynthesis
MPTKLSILVPVYNERYAISACLDRVLSAPLPAGVEAELVVVDDCSTDGTREILEGFAKQHAPRLTLARHEANRGKGAAIRTAIALAKGDICLIQDADMEYDPADYPALLEPLLDGSADAVYGSRFMSSGRRRAVFFWHAVANRVLTTFCNLFTNLWLSDMETGYKAIRTPFLRHLPIRCDRFGVEPELTMKLAKQRCRVYEVPIRYNGRTYDEGKKIGAWDGVKAFFVIVWFWLVDDLYTEDSVGRVILTQLNQTPRFNFWMAQTLAPYVGRRALELGAGIGNMSAALCKRELYVSSDVDSYY